MTTLTRQQLTEELAIAFTNHAIALDEETMAWNEYDLAVETLSGYQVTLFGQRAEFATTARIEAYRKVDALKAQLLEREEIAAALDEVKASLTRNRMERVNQLAGLSWSSFQIATTYSTGGNCEMWREQGAAYGFAAVEISHQIVSYL